MKNTVSTQKVKVSLVEMNPLFMEGYLQLLSLDQNIEVTDYDTSARSIFERMKKKNADVVLSNVESTDWDATELWSRIRMRYPDTRLVINGNVHPGPLVKLLIQQGISSYFLKEGISKTELIRIVMDAHYKGVSKTSVVTEEILNDIEKSRQLHNRDGLSEREYDILFYTCEGLLRKEIADELNITESTVKFHLDKIRERYRCQTVLQLVIHALREGIVTVKN